ncbi:MAG: hypothetical protein IT547_02395 [Hyphomonadaceae bacterium]|nr:hypothetical protein [Hyphomonadaceae bacterium]
MISAVVSAIVGVAAHYWPNVGREITPLLWQLPLWVFGGVVCFRLLLSPFWMAEADAKGEAVPRAHLDPLLRAVGDYQGAVKGQADTAAIVARLANQYDELMASIAVRPDADAMSGMSDKVEAARLVLKQIRQYVPPYAGPKTPVIIEKGWNTFVVLLGSVMRIPPDITFGDLPDGVHAEVTQKTTMAFSVKFWPENIRVTNFSFAASAEL